MYKQKMSEPTHPIAIFLEEEGHLGDYRDYVASTPRGKPVDEMLKEYLEIEELEEDFEEWLTIEKL